MVATIRCRVGFCGAIVPLNDEEESRLASLPNDESTADVLCIACGVHSRYVRQDLVADQMERYYSARHDAPAVRPGWAAIVAH